MKTYNIGVVGLGGRGRGLMRDVILQIGRGNVTAVCDKYEDRIELASDMVVKAGQPEPEKYTDYRELIASKNVDVVIIVTSWQSHTEIAVAAMNAGKPTAMEVGGAYSIEQCWELVDTYERTGTPFMFLENCCFGKREMMVLNMVKQGLFGEIVHCEGGYRHDLRYEISHGWDNRHYRLDNYLNRNCENYPTHDLGPIAKVLNINHGNRLLTLTSMASKSAGLHDYIIREKADDKVLCGASFKQGDIITTLIKCAGGETVTLSLDTTLPRYYSRNFTVRGSLGMYEEVTDSVFIDSPEARSHDYDWLKKCAGNAEEYYKTYIHPLWVEYERSGVRGTHDGMDWLEFKCFFDCLEKGKPMPVDVYDAATWMSVTALSEQSIARGGAVMDIPDFTRGRWVTDFK